ncbi:MAG: hypothetical protein IJ551_08085 [Prevotella sp.]|nr:hypothetical protein [Prevotella sp.]
MSRTKLTPSTNASQLLEAFMKEVGLNNYSLAEKIGIRYKRIYDIQSGRVKTIRPDIVVAIRNVWPKVNPEYFYEGQMPIFLGDTEKERQESKKGIPEMVESSVKQVMDSEDYRLRIRSLQEREENIAKRELMLSEREKKYADMFNDILSKDSKIREREEKLLEIERSILSRELAVVKRESEFELEKKQANEG